MRASLIRILVIVAVAVGVGLIRARDLPWIPNVKVLKTRDTLHQTLRETVGVSLEQLLELIDQGAVVIDARSREAYEAGHLLLHCDPPVLNVPAEEIEAHVTRLMDLQGLPVVLYCQSQTCDYAEELYVTLQEFGFTDIRIYFPGWEGILAAGLETTTGPDTWTGFYDEATGQQGNEATGQEGNEEAGQEGNEATADEVPEDANVPGEVEP
jgi:rhodanese-related sulfurtransferase